MSLLRRGSAAFVVAALTGPDDTGQRFGTLAAPKCPQAPRLRTTKSLCLHVVGCACWCDAWTSNPLVRFPHGHSNQVPAACKSICGWSWTTLGSRAEWASGGLLAGLESLLVEALQRPLAEPLTSTRLQSA